MKNLRQKLVGILGGPNLKKLTFLFAAILFTALFESIGIASVLPFMQLVTNPEVIETNPWLSWAYQTLGFEQANTFILITGLIVLLLIGISNGLAIFTRWYQYRFSWNVAHFLAVRLLKKYTAQPYAFFLMHNSSDMGKQILAEVGQFTTQLVIPGTDLCARIVAVFFIFSLLIVVDPMIAGIAFTLLGTVYAVIFLVVRGRLTRMGAVRLRSIGESFRTATEFLTGIKPIKAQHCEEHFTGRFARAFRSYCDMQTYMKIISDAPRYVVETVAFGGIVVIVLYFFATNQGLQAIIPLLTLYAVAGYRLLPSLQKIYHSASCVRYNYQLVETLYEDLEGTQASSAEGVQAASKAMVFKRSIRLEGVSFRYPDTDEAALHNVTLEIPRNARVAFTGPTGSGKTTLVDIILGLLHPESGQVFIDDVPVTPENVSQWQAKIGYVPQEVFFTDDTLARNIAFGVGDDAIDLDKVKEAAHVANIDAFIERELPLGYETIIGERGIRSSGGQRQRFGLARALYRDPEVLILDEATSALDGITEEAVMEALNALPGDVTVILIAHRLATVKHCDFIYLLEHGRFIEQGTYAELVEANPTFREMARTTS